MGEVTAAAQAAGSLHALSGHTGCVVPNMLMRGMKLALTADREIACHSSEAASAIIR